MRRVVPLVFLVAACGGPQIPQHSGYKNDKSTPWTKAKPIKLNDKFEGKVEDDLNYAKHQRAKWYELAFTTVGELDVNLDITPPGDETNEEFDLGMEIYDPGYRVISKSDLEDSDEAGNLQKKKTLKDLAPGRYLIHLYLQSRVDTADFTLKVAYRATGSAGDVGKSNFPQEVMFTQPLPQVPMTDDAPPDYKPVQPTKVVVKNPPRNPPRNPPKDPPKDPPPPKVAAVSARILATSVVGGGVQITVGRGTETGAAIGMKVSLKGLSGQLTACNARSCTAVLAATIDQVKAAGGDVMLTP